MGNAFVGSRKGELSRSLVVTDLGEVFLGHSGFAPRDDLHTNGLRTLGVTFVRGSGLTVDRPFGLGEWLLIHYRAEMLTRTAGEVVLGQPDDCLLCEPSFPQWFNTRALGHVYDWMHFRGPAVPELVARYEVPVNTLFRPHETDYIPLALGLIKRELYRREAFWADSVRTMVEGLLLRMGRLAKDQQTSRAASLDLAGMERLRSVRMEVHQRLGEHWTVASMAELARMSPSHFARRYKRLFRVGPVEDLIQARIARARALLMRGFPVGEAAAQAGFTCLPYFSRHFHRRVGCAPRDYHRSVEQR